MNAFALHAPADRSGTVRWSVSAGMIIALHAALIAAGVAWTTTPIPPGVTMPTILVDLAPASSAPEPQRIDLAPGPEMQQADAPPPPPELARREPEPSLAPTPPQDRPEVQAPPEPKLQPAPATAEPVKAVPDHPKPVLKPKPVRDEAKQPSERPPAPRTSAAPRAERVAPSASAVTEGATATAALASYGSLLNTHLQHFKQYPASARAAGERGTSILSFTVSRGGQVLSSHLARSSGHPALDAETLDLVRRAQPLPAFPPDIKQASKSFTMAIPFSLR
jgi:protein TonB